MAGRSQRAGLAEARVEYWTLAVARLWHVVGCCARHERDDRGCGCSGPRAGRGRNLPGGSFPVRAAMVLLWRRHAPPSRLATIILAGQSLKRI